MCQKYAIHLSVIITRLLSNGAHGMAALVEQCLRIFYFDHIRYGDCKIEYSKHFKRF